MTLDDTLPTYNKHLASSSYTCCTMQTVHLVYDMNYVNDNFTISSNTTNPIPQLAFPPPPPILSYSVPFSAMDPATFEAASAHSAHLFTGIQPLPDRLPLPGDHYTEQPDQGHEGGKASQMAVHAGDLTVEEVYLNPHRLVSPNTPISNMVEPWIRRYNTRSIPSRAEGKRVTEAPRETMTWRLEFLGDSDRIWKNEEIQNFHLVFDDVTGQQLSIALDENTTMYGFIDQSLMKRYLSKDNLCNWPSANIHEALNAILAMPWFAIWYTVNDLGIHCGIHSLANAMSQPTLVLKGLADTTHVAVISTMPIRGTYLPPAIVLAHCLGEFTTLHGVDRLQVLTVI
ncbi:uncharacterized protein EV420DRAFT_1487301 [Desarmillaria tabescens]|uniref:Uncharacterized protein n=1 Tax=Armillaria tabescens TaxID=1929756 RepID=A0AA39JA68_ARMTA|nr:uncharacterized protein EV420DRAFT_1487301 [Desarmillaria tabescens]KAK0436978.1 hypothetical protein EV420DRAFT_1487301 [Desarmillaria tabescens]